MFTDTFLSSTVQRVIESAEYFKLGFGQDAEIITIDELDLPVNWILPFDSCPKFNSTVFKKVSTIVIRYYLCFATRRIRPLQSGQKSIFLLSLSG